MKKYVIGIIIGAIYSHAAAVSRKMICRRKYQVVPLSWGIGSVRGLSSLPKVDKPVMGEVELLLGVWQGGGAGVEQFDSLIKIMKRLVPQS